MAKYWMKKAFSKNKGALHKQLGVSGDKNIPVGRLKSAAHSKNSKLRHRAQAALNARHINPWEIREDNQGIWVVRQDTGEKMTDKPYPKTPEGRASAEAYLKKLYAVEGISQSEYEMRKGNPKEATETTKRIASKVKSVMEG